MSMLLKGKLIPAENPEKEARIQTIQASLITSELEDNPELLKKWERLYAITAFYVGVSMILDHMNIWKQWNQYLEMGQRILTQQRWKS